MDINTLPYVPQVHLFESELNTHLLLANGSQIYGIDEDLGKRFKEAIRCYDNELVDRLLEENGLQTAPRITNEPPKNIKLHSISLAVAQKCNLGCTYCYAQEGSFGGAAKNMSLHTAFRSVDMLLEKMEDGEKAHITYLGGEPLINRELIHKTTEYAKRLATSRGIQLGFSLTTNGTLIEAVDMYFFEEHGFAVTISIDGIGEIHDRLRPNKGGKGSYDNIIKRVSPMLKMQRNMQVSARVTVTPKNLALTQTLDELVGLGFHSVGFSPMLSSPTGREEMDISSLELMLAQMIECGETFEKNMLLGKRYPFSNMVNALKEIHKGTHRPYPCGAGAGYMGISADGDLAA
ncbi:MAG: radical SAM protein, partial [Ferruginibacter sp.]